MRWSDLLEMCLANLRRRKGRTILTMIGVAIGSCAILVMMSIGFGFAQQQERLLASLGDLTTINLMSQGMSQGITEKNITEIRNLEHVQAVMPKMTLFDEMSSLTAGSNDRYITDYLNLVGIPFEELDKFGYEFLEDNRPAHPAVSLRDLPVLVGENYAYSFRDTLRPEGKNRRTPPMNDQMGMMAGPMPQDMPIESEDPFFDPAKTRQTLTLSLNQPEGPKSISRPLSIKGVLKGNWNQGYETYEGVLMDISQLKALRKELYQTYGIQMPAFKGYNEGMVKVDDMKNVEAVEKQIGEMGIGTSSQASIRKGMEETTRNTQLVLGGIGSVSLIVAAVGIANTMIMSITERTREIGIMKAIGCRLQDIRLLFLTEAAFIGFFGGLIGLIVSLIVSLLINVLTSSTPITDISTFWSAISGYGTRLSVIPPWLIGFSLIFSTLIGLISGYSPASKAMRISALEAIKHE